MIISRTPFRISLFGGGTDYPVWFKEHGGAVLGTTIDKYCYITARYLPPYFSHKSRIVYSKEEWVSDNKDIEHPAVREALKFLNIDRGVEICHMSDLFAKKGLGASSAFAVGLLNALTTLQSVNSVSPSKEELAYGAINLEQNWIKENVGCQDQCYSAYGGFNHIQFNPNGLINVTPINPPKELLSYLMLFDIGTSRIASEIAAKQIAETPKKERELSWMCEFVRMAIKLLGTGSFKELGHLMNDNWHLKKSLSDKISTPQIDAIYETALKAGAMGGKILGAGGGGYMLFFADPDKHGAIKQALNLRHIPFRFENTGSRIIFNDERDRFITS